VTDLNEFTARAARMWGLADYAGLAELLAPASARLTDLLPAGPGRVLDLAAGTGTLAAALADRGATVDAVDLSPRMVELGRARTAGLDVTWHEGDAERLAFPERTFDAVLSSFGMIFAPRPDRVLTEVRRVLRPGGTLAFTAWTPQGFVGTMTERMREWLPAPEDIADLLDWGREPVLQARLTDAGFTAVRVERTTLPWHFESGPAMTRFLLDHSPAHHASAAALGERAHEMFTAVEQLAAPDGGQVRVEAEYLLVAATATAESAS
jgi:SAM-dependent methyltransferase